MFIISPVETGGRRCRFKDSDMENASFPLGRRYNSFVGYLGNRYGGRLQKLVVDAGFTCPNRDGTLGRGGCSFCDNAAFHPGYSTSGKSIIRQLDEGIEFHRVRYRRAEGYLAYFQSFSNTYAPLGRLRAVYSEALSHPLVKGLVIGTRPDCVDEDKLDYLRSLQDDGHIVIVEYGIESCYDSTLQRIGRGHDFATARRAVEMTAGKGIDTGAHFIVGLPGETRQMILDGCEAINSLPLRSVKFHQLQLVKGTRVKTEFEQHPEDFLRLPLDGYIDLMVDMLERLRPDLCIERVAGEVPPRFVDVPQWGLVRNFQIVSMLEKRLEERDTYQGALLADKL